MIYYLNEDKTYRVATTIEWGMQFESMDRKVGYEIIEGHHVSTVWLGIDHNHFGGKPLVFETMVFDKEDTDIYCERYSTWDEAVEGHKKAVQWVLDGCKDE